MSLTMLHVLFLLQLAWQVRDSPRCPQLVPPFPRLADDPDLKLL